MRSGSKRWNMVLGAGFAVVCLTSATANADALPLRPQARLAASAPAQPPAVTTAPAEQPPQTTAPAQPPSSPGAGQPPSGPPQPSEPSGPPQPSPPAESDPLPPPPGSGDPPPSEPPASPPGAEQDPPAQPGPAPSAGPPTPGAPPPGPAPTGPQPPAASDTAAAQTSPTDAAPVPDAAWEAMMEKEVVVEQGGAEPVRGKLVALSGDTAVIVAADGQVQTVLKSEATKLSVPKDEPKDVPDANAPKPAKSDGKAVEAKDDEKNAEKDDDYAKLGLFTSHGVSYSHWRTSSYREGAAAYALDVGIGYNFRKTLGLYVMLGGHVGAGLLDKSLRASLGHLTGMFRYNGKYFAFLGGLGLGWSGERTAQGTDRSLGVAVPLRFIGKIPLPKHWFIGLGAGYEPAFLRGPIMVNAVSLQLVVGRW